MKTKIANDELMETLNSRKEIIEQFKKLMKKLVYDLYENGQWPDKKEICRLFGIAEKHWITSILEKPDTYSSFKTLKSVYHRGIFIHKYSFAIPCKEALDIITKHSPILEVGCGSGFWAMLLTMNRCRIIPTTINEKIYPFQNKFTLIEEISGIEAVKKYPDRTVFISWPNHDSPCWATDVLRKCKGKAIYIGENGGCTGDDKFHEILHNEFKLIEDYDLPKFDGFNDFLWVYERVKSEKRK